jgi:hypothetical protein
VVEPPSGKPPVTKATRMGGVFEVSCIRGCGCFNCPVHASTYRDIRFKHRQPIGRNLSAALCGSSVAR